MQSCIFTLCCPMGEGSLSLPLVNGISALLGAEETAHSVLVWGGRAVVAYLLCPEGRFCAQVALCFPPLHPSKQMV